MINLNQQEHSNYQQPKALRHWIVKAPTALVLALSCISMSYAENSPINAQSTVESFEKLFGVTKGKRRNHTKGFCFEANLIPTDSAIKKLTTSTLFLDESNVIGRLSHKGGNNHASDDSPAEYGLGLSISTSDGYTQLMSMNTLDFFPVATPEAFSQLMRAKVAGGDAVKKFKDGNINLQRFKADEAGKPKTLTPYEGSTYNSINSFYLVDDNQTKTAIRWSFVPSKEQKLVVKPSQDFFFDNLKKNLAQHQVAWDMVITLANSDDIVDNPALKWEGEHETHIAAKLVINSIASEANGKCDLINFDPLVLAPGFEPSADPILQARRNAYAIGFGKRLSEKANIN